MNPNKRLKITVGYKVVVEDVTDPAKPKPFLEKSGNLVHPDATLDTLNALQANVGQGVLQLASVSQQAVDAARAGKK